MNKNSIAYQSIFGEYHKDEDRITYGSWLRINGSRLMTTRNMGEQNV